MFLLFRKQERNVAASSDLHGQTAEEYLTYDESYEAKGSECGESDTYEVSILRCYKLFRRD